MVLERIKIELKGRTKASTKISLSWDPFWTPGINTVKETETVLAFYSMKGQVK